MLVLQREACSANGQRSPASTTVVLSQLRGRSLCVTAGIKLLLSEEAKAIFSAPYPQTVEEVGYNGMQLP